MLFFGVGRVAPSHGWSSTVKSSVGTVDFGLLGGPRISFLPTSSNLNALTYRFLGRACPERELPKSEQL